MTDYRPDPKILELGREFYDPVEPARFPAAIPRFLNNPWAEQVGLGGVDWEAHFQRFEPLPDNLIRPLALRYHGHQFRSYNPEIGDGRGFLFAQLRDAQSRLLDLGTKGSGQTPYSRFGDGRLTLKGGVR
jgi:serine/tyrosine/threonine adenylyltransferase